jgi:hypothetical protein
VLNELIGHYVNYRKQVSPSMQELLPETDFRLFAVSVRFPQGLARQGVLTAVQPRVYDVRHFTGLIRVVVVHELPREEHNALLHLFSAQRDLLRYGATHYRPRSEETSTLLLQLFERYRLEARLMPDPLQQLAEETINELLPRLPVEWHLKGLSVDELLAGMSLEFRAALAERLKDQDTPPSPAASEPNHHDRKD